MLHTAISLLFVEVREVIETLFVQNVVPLCDVLGFFIISESDVIAVTLVTEVNYVAHDQSLL